MKSEILAAGILIPIGASFAFIGLLLMYLFRSSSGAIRYREFYAQNLSAQGEFARSEKIRNETERIKRQTPIFGKSLLWLGIGIIIFSLARIIIQK